ncbi:MAG: hypothetical protein RR351_01990, partial [Christensenella sp.]
MILKKLKTSDFWYSNLFYILAIIFVIGFGIANPKFLDGANIANIFAQSSVLIIMSIGMALALITKGMDMSVGSTLFLCAATMQILNKNFDIGMPEMMMISIAVGLAAGALNGFIVSMFNVYPLLPTLATMFAYKGIALIIGGGDVLAIDHQCADLGLRRRQWRRRLVRVDPEGRAPARKPDFAIVRFGNRVVMQQAHFTVQAIGAIVQARLHGMRWIAQGLRYF